MISLLFYYDKFYRTFSQAKSTAYKKSRSLNRHYNSNGKKIEDESQDLVSFILSTDYSEFYKYVSFFSV
jgi:hypothetical protein